MGQKDQRHTKGSTGAAAAKIIRSFRSPRLKVNVTKEIIKDAVRAHSGWCMISEAVKIAAPWATSVSTDIQTIRLTDPRKGLRYTYLTPRPVQEALIDFDAGREPTPAQFTLRAGHVSTAFKRTPAGSSRRVHRLGRRRLEPAEGARDQKSGHGKYVLGTVGGPPPPRPAVSFRREFGLRAYTGKFEGGRLPVGAPSISER